MRKDRRVPGPTHLVALELVPQLREVVDLAVEDAHNVPGLVRHGLEAGLEVDHAQPLVAEHAAAERVGRALVGPTVNESHAHGVDELGIRRARRRIESGDAAHG